MSEKRYEENMNETERGKNETKETERGKKILPKITKNY